MAVLNQQNRDSFETAFEQGVSQVRKQVVKVADEIKQDVVESVIGTKKHEEVSEQVTAEDKQKVAMARSEVRNLDEKMKKIKEDREKKWQQANQTSQAKQANKAREEQKKESIFAQMLKAKKGTKEALRGVSG